MKKSGYQKLKQENEELKDKIAELEHKISLGTFPADVEEVVEISVKVDPVVAQFYSAVGNGDVKRGLELAASMIEATGHELYRIFHKGKKKPETIMLCENQIKSLLKQGKGDVEKAMKENSEKSKSYVESFGHIERVENLTKAEAVES